MQQKTENSGSASAEPGRLFRHCAVLHLSQPLASIAQRVVLAIDLHR